MIRSAPVVGLLALSGVLVARQVAPPIRAVSAPTAVTTERIAYVDEVRELPGGKLLVNSVDDSRLLLFDASLANATTLLDTLGAGTTRYPRFGRLISYVGDSTLFLESDSRSFVVVDPQGKLGRVMALPKAQDFNMLISTGPVGADARGNMLYRARRAASPPAVCAASADAPAAPAAPKTPPPSPDSIEIVRASFETRQVDTIGRQRTIPLFELPKTVTDGNCKILSATVRVNPSMPSMDEWTVTSRGVVAIVRGHDYHVDFIDPDGTHRSGPKLPFDWRRLTDADKQRRIDSARKIIDSVTANSGYRLLRCGASLTYTIEAPDTVRGTFGSVLQLTPAQRGRAGEPPSQCQTVIVTPEFVPLSEMADYVAPLRDGSVEADLDGNVWILPTTSLSAKGGLLYDVVAPSGEMIERVQLPADRSIAGFGRGGVVYLIHRTAEKITVIERVKVLR